MNEHLLREFLADLHVKFLELRKAHHATYKMAAATRLALRDVPGFEESYAKHWGEQSILLDGQFSEVERQLEEVIRRLRDFS